MIDPDTEHIYDIILSIFLGIMIVLIMNSLYDEQRSIIVTSKNN